MGKGFWKSLAITFVTTFLFALSPALGDPSLTWEAVKLGALAGTLFTAGRLAIKSVVELLIAHFSK